MSSESEVDTVTVANRKFISRKGKVTLARKALEGLLDQAESLDFFSAVSASQIEIQIEKLNEQQNELERMATALDDLIAAEDETEEFNPTRESQRVWDQVGTYQDETEAIKLKAVKIVHDLKAAVPGPGGAGGAAGGGAAGGAGGAAGGGAGGGGGAAAGVPKTYKDNESMKPKTPLSMKHSPEWYAEWRHKAKAYFESSQMERFPPSVAREYFMTLISNDDLGPKVRARLGEHTPIWGNRHNFGMMEIIDEEYSRDHPVMNRRIDWLNVYQGQNENFADLIARLDSADKEADVQNMGVDDYRSLRLFTAVSHKETRKQMLMMGSDNLRDLRECGLRVQATLTATAKLNAEEKSSANNVYPKNRGKGGGGGNRGGGGNGNSGGGGGGGNGGNKNSGGKENKDLVRAVKDGRCTGCGRQGGCFKSKGGCKVNKDYKCKIPGCNKTGHWETWCFKNPNKGTRWNPNARANNTSVEGGSGGDGAAGGVSD